MFSFNILAALLIALAVLLFSGCTGYAVLSNTLLVKARENIFFNIIVGMCVIFLPLFYIALFIQFSQIVFFVYIAFAALFSLFLAWKSGLSFSFGQTDIKTKINFAVFLITGLAIGAITAQAICVKDFDANFSLISIQIFDHAKISIIDSITREGLPVQNPFGLSGTGNPELHYYYFWYFIAAVISSVFSISGHMAEYVLMVITGFLTFSVIVYISQTIFGKHRSLLAYTVFSAAACLTPSVADPHWFPAVFRGHHGLETLLYQLPWVPQHVFSALCVICFFAITIELVPALPGFSKTEFAKAAGLTAITASVGFASSAYVGGITFGLMACAVLVCQLVRYKEYRHILLFWGVVGIAAIIISLPMIQNTLSANSGMNKAPIGIQIWKSLATGNDILNILSYFSLTALIYFGVSYLCFLFVLFKGKFSHKAEWMYLCVASLVTPLFVASIISNNDLGWRAVLPFVIISGACLPAVVFSVRRKYCYVLLALLALQFSNSYGYVKEILFGSVWLKAGTYLEASVNTINQYTEKKSMLLMNTPYDRKYEGRNYLIPAVVDRKLAYLNGSFGSSLGENTVFNDIGYVERQIHSLFFDGIVPSYDFLKKMAADYVIVLKDDPVFRKELSSDYLSLVYQDENTKIYKLATSL